VCYGFKNLKFINNNKFINNYKYRRYLSIKSLNISWNQTLRFNRYKLSVQLPPSWDVIIFQNPSDKARLIIYLYSNKYTLNFPLLFKFSTVSFDLFEKTLALNFKYKESFFFLFFHFLKNILHGFTKFFFRKIKFKGKGYYIYKNKRLTVTPQFGYAHRIYVYAYLVNVFFF
jgi:hypothetical protein